MPPNKLGHEGHVWIGNLSSLSDKLETFVKGDLLCKDHVAKNHRCRSGNALNTVNIDSSSFLLGSFDEFDDLVEAAFYVLSDVVLEME